VPASGGPGPGEIIGAVEERDQARRRPFGVVLLTLLLLAYSALSIPFVLDLPDVAGAGLLRVVGDAEAAQATHVLLSSVAAIAAVGLWLRRRWGWVAAMLLAGPTLAVEVFLYFRGEAAYAYMAVAMLIALYLNSADVRSRFFPDQPVESADQAGGVDVARTRP
jgi:hypothetical protein